MRSRSMRRGAAMHASLGAGRPVAVEEVETLADSLGGGVGLDNRWTFAMCRDLLDDVVLVEEDEIAAAIRRLYDAGGEVVEGAGAVGVTALLLLYPELPMARIVGSDIAHAVPLTLIAGAGHWALGSIDWQLMGVLLIGSLPGIAIGSYCAVRVPETALRLMLAAILVVVAGKLGAEQWRSSTPNVAAAAARAPARAQGAPVVVPIAIGAHPVN